MIKSLTTAATGMTAQQTNMDVIANNIANANSVGFRSESVEFEDLMYQTIKEPGAITGEGAVAPTGVQVGLGVKTHSTVKDFDQGAAKVTQNPFDMEIEGSGFFPVQLPSGQIAYTRDGAFTKGPDGRLQDKNGNILQPEIAVPPEATGIDIAADGQVSIITADNINQPQNIGQITLVGFVNPAGLRSMGKNLYMPSNSSGLPQQSNPGQNGLGTIAQGQLETSNVNIVDEMVNMISAQRAFETNSKVIQASDQMLQQINSLR
ncbi:MAG: flagellar basal-body rod protein FlgG [Bdellovibrionales bacterium]|nr:flagellar basal-body rod protein FlgG [Bdellovibrionales bacterium]